MKLLAIRVEDHDSNLSFFDGKKVRYLSTERLYHVKHHGLDNFHSWKDIVKEHWDLDYRDLDAIGIVTNLLENNKNLFLKVDFGYGIPTFAVDHHFAHALSVWPVQNVGGSQFVFDGQGNNFLTHSLFEGSNLSNTFHRYNDGSIASRMRDIGRVLRFKGANQGLLQEMDLAGKVMGYQSYGNLNKDYYNHLNNFSLKNVWEVWSYKLITDIPYIDWLHTVHEWTGDKLVDYFSKYKPPYTFTGGTAQNSVFNGKLYKKFNMQFVPTVSDGCLSLGTLEFLRIMFRIDPFPTDGFPFWQSTDESPELTDKTRIKKIAELLARGKIVGVYQGQGEIGPRALGNRSILMDPRIKDGKDVINNKVKHRESFRPFGGACLLEDANTYFDAPREIPFMNVNVDVKTDEFPSITHVDNSTRLQTVKDGVFYEILTEFKKLTGYGVLLNTSLNIAGKPIASKTAHAKQLFNTTDLDVIFVGNEAQLK